MLWSGLEPLRLAAPPPQDGVSTNFTTRARGPANSPELHCCVLPSYHPASPYYVQRERRGSNPRPLE